MSKLKYIRTLYWAGFIMILLLTVTLLSAKLPAYAEKSSPAVTPTITIGTTAAAAPTPTPDTTTPAVLVTPTTEVQPPTVVVTNTELEKQQAAKEELKKTTLAKAKTYNLTRGQPLPEAIDAWLASCHSPQMQEAPPGKTIGQLYLELGWKYGVNPAYALAFFTKESSCGTAGDNLAAHDFGNIRATPGYPTLDGVWRSYPSWTAGMEDWFKLIKEGYVQAGGITLGQILPIYAPESENDTTLYMNQVMGWVDLIMASSPDQDLNLEYVQKEAETGFQVGWDFLDYWRSHGGEGAFGNPLGNQEYEDGQVVQYFEKAVLEYHPENKPPDKVLVRIVENEVSTSQPAASDDPAKAGSSVSVSQTIKWLAGWFADLGQEKGGLSGKIPNG